MTAPVTLDLFAVAARREREQLVPPAPPAPLPHFVSTSATSREAAISMHRPAAQLRERVRAFIAGRGDSGATDEEIAASLQLNPSTARPRRCELVEAGLVVDSGITRATHSGRQATVWRAAAAGVGRVDGP